MYVYLDASPPYNTPFRVWGRMISQWLTVHKSEPSPSRWLGPCVSFHGPPIAEDATNPLAIHGLYSAAWGENILGTIARVFSQWYQHVAFESMRIIFPNGNLWDCWKGSAQVKNFESIYTQNICVNMGIHTRPCLKDTLKNASAPYSYIRLGLQSHGCFQK